MARLEEKISSPMTSPAGTVMLIAALIPIVLYAFNALHWSDTVAIPVAYGISILGSLPLLCIPFLARSFHLDTRSRLGLFSLVACVSVVLLFELFAGAEWLAGQPQSAEVWFYLRTELLVQALVGTAMTLFACGMRYTKIDQGEGLPRGAWLALLLVLVASGLGLAFESAQEASGLQHVTSLALSTFAFGLNASLLLRVALYQKSFLVSTLAFGQLCLALSTGITGINLAQPSLGETLLLHSLAQLYGFYALSASIVLHLRRQGVIVQDDEQLSDSKELTLSSQATVQKFREQFAPILVELVAKSEEALMSTAPFVTPSQVQGLYELNQMSWNLLQKVDELDHFLARGELRTTPQARKIPASELMLRLQRIAQKLADPNFVQVDAYTLEDLGDIEIDDVLFLQACLPLIRNAIRYTQNARITLHLYPFLREGKPHLRLDIRDWGRGLSQSVYRSLHQQKDNSVTPIPTSGIPLAHKICEQLKIELTLDSLQGKGSTWSLSWFDKQGEERRNRNLTPGLSHSSALLFTQSSSFHDELANPLSDLGIDTVTTQSLNASLRVLVEKQPALVLLEIDEQGKAFDLLETLELYQNQCQVVGLIADNDTMLTEKARQAGVRWFADSQKLKQDFPIILRAKGIPSKVEA